MTGRGGNQTGDFGASKAGRFTAINNRRPAGLKARHFKVLELAAAGYTHNEIAEKLELTGLRNVRKILTTALRMRAEELRDQGAWEQARAMWIAHHERLLAVWLPKAIAGDVKAAELALKTLAQIGTVSAFTATPIGAPADPDSGKPPVTPDVVADVLAGLATLAQRINPTIDGTVVELPQLPSPPPQTLGDLNGHRDLSGEHPG